MQLIGLVLAEDLELNSLAPLSIFEIANTVLGSRHYQTSLFSEKGGAIRGRSGVELLTKPVSGQKCDTLFVEGSSEDIGDFHNDELLFEVCWNARRIVSARWGTMALAELGILEDRRVAMHWALAEEFKRRFPRVRLEDDSLFVQDGSIWTSAGMSAGIDLALHLLDRDIGPAAVQEVVNQMVIGQRRHARNQQRPVTVALQPKSDRIQQALSHARCNLQSALTVEELAKTACLSPRQFARLFTAETGCSPARAVEKLRLEAAQLLVFQGRLPIETIALQTGFGDAERMRRAFHRTYSRSPRDMRTHAASIVPV